MERADDSLAHHVSKAKFGELVEQALAELPEQFAEHLEEVPVEVRPGENLMIHAAILFHDRGRDGPGV